MPQKFVRKSQGGTITGADGRVILFGVSKFKRDICKGECCFVCGGDRDHYSFNDEHIIPAWLVRHCDLDNESVTLPNGKLVRYASYKIPCCEKCNSLLSKKLEGPLRRVIVKGHDALRAYIETYGPSQLFLWMAAIFLKAHLKDKYLRQHVDRRKSGRSISLANRYNWADFHHLHSVVRSIYTGAYIMPNVYGSLLLLPVKPTPGRPAFDFIDMTFPQTLTIRIGDFAVFSVFNDSGYVLHGLRDRLGMIDGPLNVAQVREVTANFASCSLHMTERPTFATIVEDSLQSQAIIVRTNAPKLTFHSYQPSIFGEIMHHLFRDRVSALADARGIHIDEMTSLVRSGRLTFLTDDNGQFIRST